MKASMSEERDPQRALVAAVERDHPVLMDPVTQLPSRLHFDVVYRVVFAAGTRGFPITVLLMEAPALDPEDELPEFAKRLSAVTRRMDLLARFDESRIVALLLGCNVHGGRVAAERMVLSLEPWLEGRTAEMKVGVAALLPHMEKESELIEAARVALKDARGAPGSAIETRP